MATAGSTTSPTTRAAAGEPKFGDHDEAALLRKIVAMCSHLSALASQNTDLIAVARFLSSSVGSGIAVLDRGLEVLACAGVNEPGEVVDTLRAHAGVSSLNSVLSAAARNRRALTVPALTGGGAAVVVAPVSLGEDVAGYLLTVGHREHDLSEDMRLLVTEHAAMVCGVVLGRDLVVAAAAGRARQELVEGLLFARHRDEREVGRWARHLGFDAARSYYVLALALSGSHSGSGFAPIEALLTRLAPDAIVARRTDEVVAVVPLTGHGRTPADQGRTLARACTAVVAERRLGTATIGIGNPCHAAADIARSYAEARRALAASERMGGSCGVTTFADLGIHRLLLRVPDVADLRAFAEEVLGTLREEEQTTGMEYLTTLSVYFEENSSPRRAAQRLHVHPNTVSYRIRRVEEITGLSFDVHRDRLMAEVAVEILDGLARS